MTKKKGLKGALISSIVSIALSCTTFAGTTFAWFSDSVTSANNVIQSGNLDIDLEYWNGTAWTDVSGKSDILSNALWEPGATEVAYFKLKNAGSLALKYQFGVNIVSETAGVNKAGQAFKLSNYIYFDMIEAVNGETAAYATREDAVAAVTDATLIANGYSEIGTMVAEDVKYMAMVVYMPESVGNEANHNGTNVPKIELGVNVMATQYTYEEDDYDETYDEDAELVTTVVTSEAELVAALADAKNGDVIGIEGNVTWTTGASNGSTPFVENASTYTLRPADDTLTYVTLRGIGENATFTAIGQGVGAVGIDNGTVIFKDLKIVDESVSYAENSWEYGYLEFRGNTVFENCDIVNAVMMEGESAKFVNCKLNSNDDNQYAVWVSNGNASFDGCTVKGARGLKIHEDYGSLVDTVVIKNNEFLGLTKKPGLAIGTVDAKTTVVIQNNVCAGTQAGDQGLYIYETDTDVTLFDFVCADNMVADYADTNADLKDRLQNNATVILPEGSYTLPTMSGKEGITIIGKADGSTVIGGDTTSTGFGSNFGKNSALENLTFAGTSNGVRWSYAQGGTTVFTNCTFKGDSTYGFHIDESNGATFIFNNCTFVGFNAFAGDLAMIEFNNCTFLSNGSYGNTNVWNVAYYNNCTWGEGAGFDVKAGTEIYVNGVRAASNVTSLTEILAEDEDLVLMKDISVTGTAQLPDRNNYVEVYGNKTGFAQYTGVIDGNGHEIIDAEGDRSYLIVTHGGTIKNLTIKSGARGIVTYSPTEDVYIENVVVDGAGYALNSTEHAAVNMYVTNSTINGWTSLAGFKSVQFTGCKLGENTAKYWQSMGYDQDYDRLFRVYSPTTFTNCEFEQGYYLDMSAGGTATLINCVVNGVLITAENYADYITIEIPAGKTLADCVIFG